MKGNRRGGAARGARKPERGDVIIGAALALTVAALERIGDGWSDKTWILIAAVAVVVAGAWLADLALPALGVAAVGLILLAGVYLLIDVWDGEPAEDDCGRTPGDDAIEVLVVWPDEELRDFCDVVAGHGEGVAVTSEGPDIGTVLADRFEGDDPPDVAIVPQPSLVRQYASDGLLCPTEDEVANRFPDDWNALVTARVAGTGPERVYGATVKGAHKSLLWYERDAVGAEDPGRWSWNDLVEWIGRNVDAADFDAPLAVPAGDRWPLTDWFENQLAATDPGLYRRLASGETRDWDVPEVRRALTDMARLWRETGVLAGGPGGTARTSWSELPRLLYDGEAALAFGPSFVAGAADELRRPEALWVANFPGLGRGGGPTIVGGDFAVVPRSSGRCNGVPQVAAAQDLVGELTDDEAIERWSRLDGGFLTPSGESPYADLRPVRPGEWENVRIWLTALISEPAGGLYFDLSDDQFAAAGEDEAHRAWDVLYAFFQDATRDPPDLDCAVDQAIADLQAAYDGEPPSPPVC